MGRRRSGCAGALLAASLPACGGWRVGLDAYLWALWLVPLLGLFCSAAQRRRQRLLQQLGDAGLLPRLILPAAPGRRLLSDALMLLAVTACILGLAEIKYGFVWEEVQRRGVDVVVALDVSDSMLAADNDSGTSQSRLVRAKREVSDLLNMLQGDRIGLVAFAGTAFVQCPLTLDYGAAALFLEDFDPSLIPVPGTGLAAALRTALQALGEPRPGNQAILLISDGEDHDGEVLKAAAEAQARGVRVFTLAVGHNEGRPIPAGDGGFRRDPRGEIILSHPDERLLRQIADSTGGSHARAVPGDADLERLYHQGIKAQLEEQDLGSERQQRWHERFQWFLAAALLALLLEGLLPERGGLWRRHA